MFNIENKKLAIASRIYLLLNIYDKIGLLT